MKNQNESNANEPIISNLISDQLAPYWQELHEKLLPLALQATQIELTDRLQRLAQILEIVRIEEHIPPMEAGGRGRPLMDRRPLARAFLAKAALNLSDTRTLIEQLKQSPCFRRLCGMNCVPSEATFSRAFSAFACLNLAEIAHQAMVDKFVGERVVMHASHDSTAIEAREKAQKKVKQESVKKSEVVRKQGKNDLLRNQLVWNDRCLWNQKRRSWNYLPFVTGELSVIQTVTHIVGAVTKPIYRGPRA